VDEFHILAAGVYNLGFIAVGASATPFIDWWWERTQRDARIDPARMMFTDQRWVDFAPSLFDHYILKDPTCNVAYWNLHERDLQWDGRQYLVNGRPLTFFHFSGFDSKRPYLLSKHQGDRPRILLSERPGVARICREYLGDLQSAGLSSTSGLAYGWETMPSGVPFDRQMRRSYCAGLEASAKGRAAEPPSPFAEGGEARFMEWLNEPVAGGVRKTVSRYLRDLYLDRPDLQAAFPDLVHADTARFFEWVRRDGVVQHRIPPALLPPDPALTDDDPAAFAPASHLDAGVNIAGYFRAELGVGEAARLLTSAVEAAGIPHSTLTYDATLSRTEHAFDERGDRRAPYDVNILCVNADQTRLFARDAGPGFFAGRYTIGYWFWELDPFPAAMHHAFDYVDEVWTATTFVASGIRQIGRRPVTTVPLPVPVPITSPSVTRESLALPPGFLFLFLFDFFSVLERKNPVGLIDAFTRAFRPNEGPTLMIKTINGERRLVDLERVRAAAAERPDILIVDDYYSAEQKNSLTGLCDCYVSLHRSEGLGLTMAEAMALGKPVIATGYSGNVDFMTPENSYLVSYTTGAVPPGTDPYPQGSPWAEPNLDEAAELMRRVYEAPREAAARGERAREDILTKHDAASSGKVLAARLDEIRSRSRVTVAAPAAQPPSPPPDAALLAALERAERLATPAVSVESGRAFRQPLMVFQSLLFRVLRPYWFQQRQSQQQLILALREVLQRSAAVESTQREVLQTTAARSAAVESAQRQSLESVWQKLHALENGIAAHDLPVGKNLDPIRTELGSIRGDLDNLTRGVSTFQAAAAEHLKALTDAFAERRSTLAEHIEAAGARAEVAVGQASELAARLYAVPFMNGEDRFYYTENGRRVLGFRSGRGAGDGLYVGFEDIFRGSEEFIRGRMRGYLPVLTRHGRVVDIGSGRGEMLDLLREAGVPATGVDTDEGMVLRSRSRGHDVHQMDGIAFLRAQPDASVPAIFCAQVVEHLSYDEFLDFLRVSLAKLTPGGQLVFETVNPHSIEAFKTFYTDLTHQRPIFPEVALAWCWLTGFAEGYVSFPTGEGDLETDRRTRGEYAVVATKGNSQEGESR
jgi:glycosyltransferase involved in cell wall biosynthesis